MFFQHYREQAEKEERTLQTVTNMMGQVVQCVASEMMAHRQEGTYGTMQSHSFYPYIPPIPFPPPPPAFSQTVQDPATSTESGTHDESHNSSTTYLNLE